MAGLIRYTLHATRYTLIILSFLVSCFLFHVSPTYAADEFAVAYDITYEVEVDGNAKVVADIALTNKLSNVYATEYNLVIEKGEISQIGAWDAKGEIKIKTETETEQTKINLKFNDQIVGIDKTLRFTLKYEIANLAKKSGEVWQIILPKQANPEKLADFKVSLKVPQNFPALAFISPEPFDQQQSKDFVQYFFNQENLKEKGVVAVFGQCQIFDFTLYYHLANPKNEPVFSKIALPPTTPYQQLSYFQIEPKPENIEVDSDGNWLAVFLLSPKEKKEIVVQGQAQIYATPQKSFPLRHPEEKYLKPQPFWETDNPEIKKLASELKTPQTIYNYVIKALSYDFEKIKSKQERMGAAKALEYPNQAICMEFTDLFIALVRAAGIPARELNGFAYTDNPKMKPLSESADILHSWPEYWDGEKEIWVPVDPTWEKTSGINYFDKLDLSHFVFAIHGQDSQYPAAAGSYKEASQTQKDIQIDFGTLREEKNSILKTQFLLPKSYFSERGTNGKIVLENLGPTAFYNLPVNLQVENLNLDLKSLNLKVLPPFAKKEIPIEISGSWRPKKGEAKIELLANNQTFSYNMMANSLILNFVLPAAGGIAVGGSLILFLVKYRR